MGCSTLNCILQCSVPAFEGLLPEPHNVILMGVLFHMAEWHALAKLRMHTDDTLATLERTTETLYSRVREFCATTCTVFKTRELPREKQARDRRHQSQRSQKRNGNGGESISKEKTFNPDTYKLHSLGDYVSTIREYGTTDSYSTLLVCAPA